MGRHIVKDTVNMAHYVWVVRRHNQISKSVDKLERKIRKR